MDMLNNLFTQLHFGILLRAALLIIAGGIIGALLSAGLNKALSKRLRPHQVTLIGRITFYVVFILFLISAVQELGFRVSTLLGATGILTIAIGIASQTSLSNAISSIFIIGEKSFGIGDTIQINDIQGDILSMDFLSVKIRTSNNTMVRIPNEMLIKSTVTNLSYFPFRRVDLIIRIALIEDIEPVKKILLELAQHNPLCLDDPKPYVGIDSFADSAIHIQFYLWAIRNNYTELKSSIQVDIKNAFAKNHIEMPFPSQSLYLHDNKTV